MIERRHARQAKLREVGAEGQARIQALEVRIDDPGLAGEIAALYLAGAGVGTLVVATGRQAEAARSIDARVRVQTHTNSSPTDFGSGFEDLDPAARAVARGAHFALRALR